MRMIVVDNYEEMSKKAALIVASQVLLKPDSILGLATGSTPIGMYKELIEMHNRNEVDFKNVKTFNLDEYYGLSKDNPQSYYYFMRENLFDHINIDLNNTHIPDGMAQNIELECKNYEEQLLSAGGADIQILGMGKNGHIGFNEPNCYFDNETHLVKLTEDTISANSRFFNSIDQVPTEAISMGIKTILSAKKIVLIANGESKADAILKAVKGKITPEVPASALQLHKDVVFIIDKAAASKL